MKLETFFEKFDQFAAAPDAVEKMRELVLQLAVQGRLVSQSPNDEPADVLAATIAEDRAAFVKERSLARQRVFPPVEDDQCPFALPSGWAWTRLGNLCRVQAGFAFESAAFVQGDSGLPMIRIRDITRDHTQINFVGEYREEFLVDAGDFLVGMDGNFTVAKWRGPRALLNQRVSRLQWYSQHLEPSFFAIAAQYRLSELQGTKAYTTVDHLSSGQIENAVVPLPPLAEQKRIVAKVDELMALCDRLALQQQERGTRHVALARASLARFADAPTPANLNLIFHSSYSIPPADLRKSISTLAVQGKLVPQDPNDEPAEELFVKLESERRRFAKAHIFRAPLGEPVDDSSAPFAIPPSWKWCRLSSMFNAVADGDHLPPPKSEAGIAFLTIGNITTGTLDFEGCRFVPDSYYRGLADFRRPIRGDILYTIVGATYGRPALVESDRPFCVQRHIAILKPPQSVDVRFLMAVLRSPLAYNQASASTTGTAQPTIPLGSLRNFAAPLPPLAEQRRIVAKVEQLMALVDALETQLTASRATAANLLSALVAELTGTPHNGKVSVPSTPTTGRRGRPRKSL
jgi:type I restriction enzyme S subunit